MLVTEQLVAILGRGILGAATGVASADDAGLVRGDGCFDATLIQPTPEGLLVWDLDEHLDRFARSCALMALPTPDLDAWRSLIDQTVAAWQGGEAALKLVVTRGPEHGDGATSFLTITELSAAVASQRRGITAVTLGRGYPADAFAHAPWLLGGAKTLSYAVNVAAKREATARGADDVIFTSYDGYTLEAPTAAVVWLAGDTLCSTPHGATGILPSVSQAKVFRHAPDVGLRAEYRLAAPADLIASDGVWLVSSVRGTAPVLTLDSATIRHDERVTEVVRGLHGF